MLRDLINPGIAQQQPQQQMGGSLLGNPLIALGAGLLQSSGPSLTPVGTGQGIGVGLQMMQRAQQQQEQAAERRMRTGLLGRRMDMEGMRFEAEQEALRRQEQARLAQQQATQSLLQQIPEEQRGAIGGLLAADPSAGMEQIQSLLFPEQATDPTLVREYQFAQGQGYGGSFLDYMAAKRPPGTTVNVNSGGGSLAARAPTEADATALGMPLEEMNRRGIIIQKGVPKAVPSGTKLSDSEFKQYSQALDARSDLQEIQRLVASGKVEIGPTMAARSAVAASPTLSGVGNLVGAGLSADEATMASAVERVGTTMLAAMRGAQVGPMEQAKFEKQMPRLGQAPELFQANLTATQKNLEALVKRIEKRGGIASQPAPKAPAPPPQIPPNATRQERLRLLREWRASQ